MSDALIQHMSPSSMMAYLTNPAYFKYRYVLGIRDSNTSVSGLIGTAGHRALECIYSGIGVDEAVAAGQVVIDKTNDDSIKYNTKVANRSALQAAYARAVNFYIDELPKYHKIVSTEEWIKEQAESMLHVGTYLPTPFNVRLDLLVANQEKQLEIIDHKFVYNYTNPDIDDFKRFIQAMFYYYSVTARYGMRPARMRFNECKTSKNSDGSPQIKEWVFEYDNPQHFEVFERLFTDVILDMNNPGRLFLPNPSDSFNGQSSFELYRSNVVSVVAPVSIKHRTEEKQFVEKQFVASVGDDVTAQGYSPEEKIRVKLQEFGISVKMQETLIGPSVIKYTMSPSRGIKLTKIAAHANDLALALAVESIRIEAPIFGTGLVGVEVPNHDRKRIDLADKHYHKNTLDIPIGVDIFGKVIYKSIADMPHLLIAGQTGAGKSVMLNVLLDALTKQNDPKDLQLVLIDPKQVELSFYEDSKHLRMPVVIDHVNAAKVLDSMVNEMEVRYKLLRLAGVRKIDEYKGDDMPRIVVVVDEFADLMMMADNKKQTFQINSVGAAIETLRMAQDIGDLGSFDFRVPSDPLDAALFWSRLTDDDREKTKAIIDNVQSAILSATESTVPPAQDSIIRIAQKARAVGIHLVLATQRPSADVVTGIIKANFPTKIAFSTTNAINSKIILDETGAEQLTGKGDMLFAFPGDPIRRLQGLYV